jgi:hypothetical protein
MKMKQLNDSRLSLMLIVVASMILIGSNSAKADYIFGEPKNLGPNVNSQFEDASQTISIDELSFYLASNRPGGFGDWDLWITSRATTMDEWEEPQNLGDIINTSSMESSPCLSMDSLTLYFCDGVWHLYNPRPGGFGKSDLWVSIRPNKDTQWNTPVNLGSTVNTTAHECDPSISVDGLSLFFDSDRSNGSGSVDLWVTNRASISDLWDPPINLGSAVNSSAVDAFPSISSDGLMLFFMSDRTGDYDLWMTKRASLAAPWGQAINLGHGVNSFDVDACPTISPDGLMLYFMSMRAGGVGGIRDLWQVPITPIIDFNWDGIIDIDDLVIMIESWEISESPCDIAPMPWGDGIVNRADLEVLMKYYNQVVDAAAYWKLDETEGMIAYDSSGHYHDANVIGDPNWQPDGGIVDGALEFDGINDYISTPFVLNPFTGPFSVFAWIKGGLPGQTIISQADDANWLSANISDGVLRTELKGGGRAGSTLVSQTVITDDNWHRIGLTWDGANRILYVDDIVAAQDTQANLLGSESGLYIGAGNTLDEDTLFQGLIDDVQIYNRAITP